MSSTQSDVTCFPSAQTVTRFPQASINQLTGIVGVTHCCLPSLQHRQNLHIPLYCCTVSLIIFNVKATLIILTSLITLVLFFVIDLYTFFQTQKQKPVLVTSYILGAV